MIISRESSTAAAQQQRTCEIPCVRHVCKKPFLQNFEKVMLGLNQYDSDSSSSSSSEEEEEPKVRQKERDVKKVEKKVEKKIEKVVKELPSASGLFGRRNVRTSVGKKRKAEDKNGLFVPPQTRMKRANKSTEDVT